MGEHETKENMVVSFGQAQRLGTTGHLMVITTVDEMGQVHYIAR